MFGFKSESREVVVARNDEGFAPIFERYFEESKDVIEEWQITKKKETAGRVDNGELKEVTAVEHNNATSEEALHLYGMNKWANENGVDMVIHLHINDDVRKNRKIPGKYSGFAIYIPKEQFQNSRASRNFAEHLFNSFKELYGTSTLPVEKGGIIGSQELIALGRYGTLNVPAVLLETGYIYEQMFAKEMFEKEFDGTAVVMSDKIYRALTAYLFP